MAYYDKPTALDALSILAEGAGDIYAQTLAAEESKRGRAHEREMAELAEEIEMEKLKIGVLSDEYGKVQEQIGAQRERLSGIGFKFDETPYATTGFDEFTKDYDRQTEGVKNYYEQRLRSSVKQLDAMSTAQAEIQAITSERLSLASQYPGVASRGGSRYAIDTPGEVALLPESVTKVSRAYGHAKDLSLAEEFALKQPLYSVQDEMTMNKLQSEISENQKDYQTAARLAYNQDWETHKSMINQMFVDLDQQQEVVDGTINRSVVSLIPLFEVAMVDAQNNPIYMSGGRYQELRQRLGELDSADTALVEQTQAEIKKFEKALIENFGTDFGNQIKDAYTSLLAPTPNTEPWQQILRDFIYKYEDAQLTFNQNPQNEGLEFDPSGTLLYKTNLLQTTGRAKMILGENGLQRFYNARDFLDSERIRVANMEFINPQTGAGQALNYFTGGASTDIDEWEEGDPDEQFAKNSLNQILKNQELEDLEQSAMFLGAGINPGEVQETLKKIQQIDDPEELKAMEKALSLIKDFDVKEKVAEAQKIKAEEQAEIDTGIATDEAAAMKKAFEAFDVKETIKKSPPKISSTFNTPQTENKVKDIQKTYKRGTYNPPGIKGVNIRDLKEMQIKADKENPGEVVDFVYGERTRTVEQYEKGEWGNDNRRPIYESQVMEIMALGGLSQKDAQKAITNALEKEANKWKTGHYDAFWAAEMNYPWVRLKADALEEGKRMIEERARKKQKMITENLQDTD